MIKVECPNCKNGYDYLREGDDKVKYVDGEGIPCTCKKCKKNFTVFISIVSEPK